jgi:DNA end-binding protein Ku
VALEERGHGAVAGAAGEVADELRACEWLRDGGLGGLRFGLRLLVRPLEAAHPPNLSRFRTGGKGKGEGMPRAIWSGAISFGLVNVPVRMYSAIDEHKLHFHYLHSADDSRIGYEKVCKQEEKPVPDDEIVKAFEYSKGEYVYMTDEDFETAGAEAEGFKTIDIRDFVPYDDIDPIYFERTYYLGPGPGGEKVYSLLLKAMEDSGLAAIAKYVLRDKQHLGCLRIRDGVITLEKMYFADEIRPLDEIKPKKARVSKDELRMAQQLIDSFGGEFEPEKYKDTYRDALCDIIRRKRKGEEVHVEPVEKPEEAPDLMEALRASLESAGGSRKNGKRRNGLGRLSKQELYDRARKADIPGRADMSKEELIEALKAA